MYGLESAENVCVFCRIRPPDGTKNSCNENNEHISVINNRTLRACPPPRSAMAKSGSTKECDYFFSQIFDPSVAQDKVFMEVAYPLVKELLHYRNGLIFTYGVTGSGKTHTMQGKPKSPGMLPRVLDTIFNSIGDRQTKKYVIHPDRSTNDFIIQSEADAMMERQQLEILSRQGTPSGRGGNSVEDGWLREIARVSDFPECGSRAYAVFVSYIEIYNNYVYDLLDELFENPITGVRAPQSKSLREDYRKMMFVYGSTEIEVKSAEEAYNVFLRGRRRRKVAHTVLNTESSRSHSVFTVRLVSVKIDSINGEVLQNRNQDLNVAQLSLVDLAGSERSQRTGTSAGDRLREAGNINNTLMTLRKCIDSLRNNQVVPYRDTRLTHLFKSYFEGWGRVRVLVCISTKSEEFDETINVLKFAEESSEVRIRVPRTPNSTRKMPPPPSPSLSAVRKVGTPLVGLALTESSESSDSDIELADEEEMLATSSLLNDRCQAFQNSLSWMSTPISDVVSFPEVIDEVRESEERHLEAETTRNSLINLLRERLVARRRHRKHDRRRAGDAEDQATRVRQEKSVLERRVRALEQKNEKLARSVTELEAEKKALIDSNGELAARVRREIADRQRMKDLYQTKLQVIPSIFSDTRSLLPGASSAAQLSQQNQERQFDGKDKKTNTPRPPTALKPRAAKNVGYPLPTGNVRRLRQNFSPPPPHANPRYQHRRSRSADERWVDHHSKHEVPTGTVLQPSLSSGKRKRKSVTQLDAKEVSTATNYVLTHQQADAEGNLETHLFKANVIPTVGGGAAVVFNDVESLTQGAPQTERQLRKRSISQPVMTPQVESEDESEPEIGRLKRVKESVI